MRINSRQRKDALERIDRIKNLIKLKSIKEITDEYHYKEEEK
jgi:hypothetical protein